MPAAGDPTTLLSRAVETDRVHSGYLIAGPGTAPRDAACHFARALVCRSDGERPCDDCVECRRSREKEDAAIEIDGTGKRGPLLRHIGDHPDLLWVQRGPGDTRVRIGQIRALQSSLRLGSNEGGWRVAVVADAEWMNQESQNALLRLLEEPPDRTCLVLVTASASGLLATIRSRCQRVTFGADVRKGLRDADLPEEQQQLVARFDGISGMGLPGLLDWAEEFRGERARAAEEVHLLLQTGGEWLRERVRHVVDAGSRDPRRELDAFRALSTCRKDLDQRNANPQMVAERALFAVREAVSR